MSGANQRTAEDWLRLISYGKSWRYNSSGPNDADWANYQRYYQGNWNKVILNQNSGVQQVTVNRGFAYVRSMAPRIYYRNPKVIIQWSDPMRGTLEKVDNYLLRKLGIKKTMKKAVLDALIYGIGIIKVGYNSQYSVETNEEDSTRKTEYSSLVRRGLPWAMRIHPASFVVPFGTQSLEDSRWCAHMVLRTLDDAKTEKRYSNRDRFVPTFMYNVASLAFGHLDDAGVKRPKQRKTPKGGLVDGVDDSELQLVVLWEIRDRATNELIIVSEGSKDIHYKEADPTMGGEFPFKTIVFNEDPMSAWGISPLRIMEPQLLELNSLRTQQQRARRTVLLKILYRTGAFKNEADLEAFFDGNDIRTGIGINGDPSTAVHELNTHIPYDLFQVGDMIEDDLRLDMGFDRNMAGIMSKGRRTATEVATVRQSGEITVDERRDITVDALRDIIYSLNHLIFQFWDGADAKRAVGQEAVWEPPDTQNIFMDYGIEVNPEDARAVDRMMMREEAIQLFQTLQADPLIDPYAVRIDLLEAFNKEPARHINPQVAQAVQLLVSNPELMQNLIAATQKGEEQKGEQNA